MTMLEQTLIFIKRDGDEILLGLKLRGFEIGKWNGYGGKMEIGELPAECAKRELFEESGLVVEVADLKYLGILKFYRSEKILDRLVHLYVCSVYKGYPRTTEEMKPKWFSSEALPFKEMWEDCAHWIEFVVKEIKFTGTFYSDNMNNLVNYCVEAIYLN
ncbi:PREDICTED: 7,8-dihydro-8-oxoguanine triphosphatase-like isoform X2 [Nicrophorus vespilloides]|nr:PREDICTED: 7,8-dihydro-8-oxoguanine triphosphatase-like isoform X2 [Nicrophorus vespilloides]